MQNNNDVSRRSFLQMAAFASGTSYLKLGGISLTAIAQAACSARDEASAFSVLGAAEASSFAAIAARIIPTTDTPGATEAGVIYFFDNVLGQDAEQLAAARLGLAGFNGALQAAGYRAEFAALAADEQDAFLRSQQDSEFFEQLRVLTIFGFFAMSRYGGNRDHVGWDLVGFAGHQGAWSYPFGYYDAEYVREHADDE